MFCSRRRFLLAGSLALASPLGYWAWKAHGRGGAAPAEEPLPSGAIARLRPGASGPEGGLACLAYSPDGRALAGGYADGTLAVWKVAGGAELLRRLVPQRRLDGIAFSPDGELLAALDAGGAVHFWKTATGEAVGPPPEAPPAGPPRQVPEGEALSPLTPENLLVFEVYVTGLGRSASGAIAFTDDGKTLVSAGPGNTVRFWEAATGKEVRRQQLQGTEKLPNEAVYWSWLALSADGRTLATATGGGWGWCDDFDLGGTSVCLWEAATGRYLRRLDGPTPSRPYYAFVFG